MRKLLTAAIIKVVGVGLGVASFGPIFIQQVFAGAGQCDTCASSFTPKSLSLGLSGTGQHGVEKIFVFIIIHILFSSILIFVSCYNYAKENSQRNFLCKLVYKLLSACYGKEYPYMISIL